MSKIIIILSIITLMAVCKLSAQPALNDTANDFTVTDIDGKTHNLYNYLNDGKFVCIDFFGVDCESCIALVPILDSLYFDYGCNQNDIVLIGINYHDTNQEIIENEINYGGHYPKVSGLEGGGYAVYNDWVVEYYPQFVIIHPDKTLVANIYPISRENIDNAFNTFDIEQAVCTTENSVAIPKIVNDFKIYPNPASDNIWFELSNVNIAINLNFSISDLNGKEILIGQSAQKQNISISALANDIYILKIYVSDNIYHQKFIVNKN